MGKNLFDTVVTVAVAPFALLVVAVMALILAVDLRGNPFFFQTRIGKNGRPFVMYKLRTMRHAAPGGMPTYQIDDWKTYVFSPPGQRDPRLTRWGEFARKTSIDELPQLLNIFKGDMSIVGPRPELPEIVAQYPAEYHRRHNVLPGIAGLAQVSGRSDLTYDEIVRHDLRYVDSHSVMTDIHILWQTLGLVFSRRGAR